MADLLIKNARLAGSGARVDVRISGERIARVEPAGTLKAAEAGAEVVDARGNLLTPPLIDSHVHLDTALTAGEPRYNASGTLFEGIAVWSERKKDLTRADVKERARTALQWEVSQGVGFVRTHVDVCDPELTALQALLELKEEVAPWVELEIVAFPQEGVLAYEGGRDLLEEALRLGADCVGGIPHYELTREDGVASIEIIFRLAEKYDRKVDIHCDEIDDEQSRFLESVAAQAIRSGLGPRVTASHTTAMGSYNGAYSYKLTGFLRRAGLNIVANPLVNLNLQGRFDAYPKRRGLTQVKELLAAGVNVSFGHDDILDPWYPLGRGSLLQVAHMGVHACQLSGRQELYEAFAMVSERAARTLALGADYGLAPGRPADLVLWAAPDEVTALRLEATALLVLHRGQVVARTTPGRTTFAGGGVTEDITFQF